MFSVVYEDLSKNYITSCAEYNIEHLTTRVFRDIITLNIFDIQNVDCHSARAYIFFNEKLSNVGLKTDFDSTKMTLMCNVLITSMTNTDDYDRYIVNTWVTRDKDVVSHLYSSKPAF